MIYCKDNKELHLSGTAELLLAQATAVAINVLKVACAGRKDEMRKEIVGSLSSWWSKTFAVKNPRSVTATA